ncbi:MAG: putative toxin-antitoxin system toxin component, PIN family [Nitrososphaerales archaeon]|nr:putative toxin-antitoxin system toxin component, PIN family [Nitrososphaerales archaeon]
MRVVPDTNVLVSAFISKHGISANILDMAATFEEITLVLSDEILEEFGDVMARGEVRERFDYTAGEIKDFKRAIRSVADVISVESNFRAIEEDPEDDVVLNTAYDGKAAYVVSGDRHLQDLKKFKGIRIVSPRRFMRIITRKFGELIVRWNDLE